MTEATGPRAELDQAIDVIEGGYEYLLAYAAQGRPTDRGASPAADLRAHLGRMSAALEALPARVRNCAQASAAELPDAGEAYLAAVESDARIARGAISLVLARSDISSQLIDNLNASIHLRAVLTDLFLLDEVLK